MSKTANKSHLKRNLTSVEEVTKKQAQPLLLLTKRFLFQWVPKKTSYFSSRVIMQNKIALYILYQNLKHFD